VGTLACVFSGRSISSVIPGLRLSFSPQIEKSPNCNSAGDKTKIPEPFTGPGIYHFPNPSSRAIRYGRSSGSWINLLPAPSHLFRTVAFCRVRHQLQRRDRIRFSRTSQLSSCEHRKPDIQLSLFYELRFRKSIHFAS
jgi:hypothetical protein